jgi:indole-3-glycerol phosphate synthase
MNILDQIIEHKKLEIAEQKKKVSVHSLENSDFFDRNTLSLKKFLLDDSKTAVIAEFKRRSPSKGVINEKSNVVDVTRGYTLNGASGLSVLTDQKFFGGNTEDLVAARENHIPILRKDFMIDEYQLIEAKAIGADVILLIAACLTPANVRQLSKEAKRLNLEVLLEIHDESEIDHVCDEVDMVGVNNRNLKTFSVDLEQSIKLAEKIGTTKLRIAESGISSVKNISYLRSFGFDGFLIGEHFMKDEDPVASFGTFVRELV